MSSSDIITPEMVTSLGGADVLRALSLAHAATEPDDAAKKAIARNYKPLSLLDHLMRDELRVRIELRARAALKRSMIFPVTTLDTYDFDFPKQIDKAAVMKAVSLDFVRDKTNVVFVGPSGVGKTHLANAIGLVAATRGYRVRFITAADLVNDLVARQAATRCTGPCTSGRATTSCSATSSATSASTRAAQTCSIRSSTSATSGPRPSSRPTFPSRRSRSG